MKLMRLSCFSAACRLGSITRAAAQLHISQPLVSAAIRELEAEFGYALLARQGKRFAFTAEGAVFLKEADRLLSHAENFETAMKQLTRGPRRIRGGPYLKLSIEAFAGMWYTGDGEVPIQHRQFLWTG